MPKSIYILLTLLSLLLMIWGAGCGENDAVQPYELAVPQGFPSPMIPDDNILNHERIALGKKLFFDKALSRDYSISCASCHHQEKAFTDGRPLSQGIKGQIGNRNSPTLVNLAWQPYFFAEGGSPSIEMQSLGPIEEAHEMGFNAREAVDRLAKIEAYQKEAQIAYGREFDLFVLTRGLAAFERTMVSGNSPFDQYQYQGNDTALNESEKRGLAVFTSEKAQCATCHPAPLFTDYSFHNIGLELEYEDEGRYRLTADKEDIGKFKVPSLRNIALTGPYMHDGRFETLEEVVEHFDGGGVTHPNVSEIIRPLGLTESEKIDLVAFLKSLTDQNFVTNPAFQE
ncbi:MAG: cytochrome-c peroxidase [Bacteroidia bacterium]